MCVFYLAKMFVSMLKKMFKTTLHVDSIMRMTHYKVLGQFFGPEVDKHFNQKEPLHFAINPIIIPFLKGICRDFIEISLWICRKIWSQQFPSRPLQPVGRAGKMKYWKKL